MSVKSSPDWPVTVTNSSSKRSSHIPWNKSKSTSKEQSTWCATQWQWVCLYSIRITLMRNSPWVLPYKDVGCDDWNCFHQWALKWQTGKFVVKSVEDKFVEELFPPTFPFSCWYIMFQKTTSLLPSRYFTLLICFQWCIWGHCHDQMPGIKCVWIKLYGVNRF